LYEDYLTKYRAGSADTSFRHYVSCPKSLQLLAAYSWLKPPRLTFGNRMSFIIRHLIAAKAIQYLTG
jgi:hypothetical protein